MSFDRNCIPCRWVKFKSNSETTWHYLLKLHVCVCALHGGSRLLTVSWCLYLVFFVGTECSQSLPGSMATQLGRFPDSFIGSGGGAAK